MSRRTTTDPLASHIRSFQPGVTQFRVGTTYSTRSIGDHDCIITYTVVARTPSFVTLKGTFPGEGRGRGRFKVRVLDGVEKVSPWGRYSMSPVLSADRTEP